MIINKKWIMYGMLAVFTRIPVNTYAQSIKRQCISSYGSSVVTENVLIGQTAGQSFNTTAVSTGTSVSPGFQQPNTFSLEEISNPALKNLDISVYPNPASRSITITSPEKIEHSLIQVTDISGKYILSEKVQDLLSHSINCASWVSGIYLITIHDAMQNSKTLRLIISK